MGHQLQTHVPLLEVIISYLILGGASARVPLLEVIILYLILGGASAPNTCTFVGSDYIISAPADKPVRNVWQINRNQYWPVIL